MKYALLALITLNVFAGISGEILVRGKIGNEFDDKKVKVVDSEGQIYYLPRNVFPAHQKLKQGESFGVEVPQKVIDKIKLLKK